MQTLIHQNRYSDVGCVYYDVTSEKSAHLWDDVRFVGPFVGVSLVVGPSLVVSLTYILIS